MAARILLLTLGLATAGCHAVRPLWEPEAFLARSQPDMIWVVQRDRAQTVAVAHPRLSGDTLRGTAPDGAPVALPWADVLDVYARRLHGTRTFFAVSSVTLLSTITLYALLQNAAGTEYLPCVRPTTSHQYDTDGECLAR